MTLPAHLRVNVGAPFPAVTKATVPITIAKANGIWVVGYSIANLATEQPSILQQQTDFITVWDSIVGNFFRVPLSSFASGGIGGSGTQRSVTAGPVVIVDSDRILNLNLSGSLTITLPGFASRNGVPLTFKDVGRMATANPLTIAAAAGETIDGNASIALNTNAQSITLVPANDGVNTGWNEE